MPDGENQIKLEISVHLEQLSKDLKKAEKQVSKFSDKSSKGQNELTKIVKDLKKQVDTLTKAYDDTAKAAKRLADAQTKSQKTATKATEDQQKKLTKLWGTMKKMGREEAEGKGFFGGLARGSGLAGVASALGAGGPGRRARMGGAIGRLGTSALSMGVGFVTGAAQQAYGTYLQYGQARYGMTGLGITRRQAAGGQRQLGAMGLTPTEAAQISPQILAATGAAGPRGGALGLAGQLAVGGGFGPGRIGEAIGFLGVQREAGARFQTRGQMTARRRDMTNMIATGMSTGLEKAKLPDFFRATAALMQQQFQYFSGKVGADPVRQQMGLLMRGGVGGGSAQRAAQVAGQLDQMVRRPGGGMAGQAVVLQAMGFGRPGGQTSYYEALKQQQKGIQDPRNLAKIFTEVNRQRGVVGAGGKDPGQQEANLQLSVMSGLSLDIVEQLQEIYNSDKSVEEKMAEVEKVLEKTLPVEKQALKATKDGFAGVKKHLAGIEAMNIAIGGEIAPEMMKLQRTQLGLVKDLAEYLPEMIKILRKIFLAIRAILGWMFKRDEVKDALKSVDKAIEKQLEHIKKLAPGTATEAAAQSRAVQRAKEVLETSKRVGRVTDIARGMVSDPRKAFKMIFPWAKGYEESQKAWQKARLPSKEFVAAQTKRRSEEAMFVQTGAALQKAGVTQQMGKSTIKMLKEAAEREPKERTAAIKEAVSRAHVRGMETRQHMEQTAEGTRILGLRTGPEPDDVRRPSAGPKAKKQTGTAPPSSTGAHR
jgi:hypothetical protein